MKIDDSEVLQLLIPNLNLKNIVKESFLKDLDEIYDGSIRVIGVNLVFGDDDAELVSLTHLVPTLEKENKLVLDVRNPEHIDLMLNILKKYQIEG